MTAGFFKVPHAVYRAVQRDANAFRVYCELASRARWTAGTCLSGHGIVELSIGQCVMGRAEVAAALGLTERTIRTAIERLSVLRVLTIETTKRGTLVTMLDGSERSDLAPSERPSVDTQNDQASIPETTIRTTTNEEDKIKKTRRKMGERASAPSRSRFVPADWQPRPEDTILAHAQLAFQLAKFRDHEFNVAKSDWNATWRNWQRDARPDRSKPSNDGLQYALDIANGVAS